MGQKSAEIWAEQPLAQGASEERGRPQKRRPGAVVPVSSIDLEAATEAPANVMMS